MIEIDKVRNDSSVNAELDKICRMLRVTHEYLQPNFIMQSDEDAFELQYVLSSICNAFNLSNMKK